MKEIKNIKKKKVYKLMHSTGVIEEYTNLKKAKSEMKDLNERFGNEYWIDKD